MNVKEATDYPVECQPSPQQEPSVEAEEYDRITNYQKHKELLYGDHRDVWESGRDWGYAAGYAKRHIEVERALLARREDARLLSIQVDALQSQLLKAEEELDEAEKRLRDVAAKSSENNTYWIGESIKPSAPSKSAEEEAEKFANDRRAMLDYHSKHEVCVETYNQAHAIGYAKGKASAEHPIVGSKMECGMLQSQLLKAEAKLKASEERAGRYKKTLEDISTFCPEGRISIVPQKAIQEASKLARQALALDAKQVKDE